MAKRVAGCAGSIITDRVHVVTDNPVEEVKARRSPAGVPPRATAPRATPPAALAVAAHTAMASATPCALSSPSALVDGRAAPARQLPTAPHWVSLPPLAPLPQSRAQRAGAYCRRIAGNVVAVATGESIAAAATTTTVVAPEESVAPTTVNGEATGEGTTELPEIVKALQQAWDKVDDKYAVSTLAFAGVVALWGTTGMISAIDRLPLVPGALEVVGIGYTGWFSYKNLIFKPEREALIQKIKNIYNDIVGTS